MITLDLSILNQKGTPMFNSDLTANRPAAGIVGRIFIATDSPYGIFRDTGTGWDQVSGAGSFSGSLATGQVAFGSATNTISGTNNLFWNNSNNRLGIGTNAPAASLDVITTSGFIVAAFKSQYLQTGYIGTGNSEIYLGTGTDGFDNAVVIGNGNFYVRQNNSQRLQIFNTGNLVLQNGGTFVDAGQRLQVYGSARIGTTAGSAMYWDDTNNRLGIGTSSPARPLSVIGNISSSSGILAPSINSEGATLAIGGGTVRTIMQATLPDGFAFNIENSGTGQTRLIGNLGSYSTTHTFAPTSGTASYASYYVANIINQTGGANGITRGSFINPTLTAAADWRSIEWSNNTGWGLYGAGTALNYLGGTLGIKTTSPYAPSTFSLDVNGGLLVKNTAGTTAQITLINADPSLGGNNGFLVASAGGTSGGSYVDFQGYYGTSIVGSTALRLNPAGGAVIVNSTTNSGEQFQLTGSIRVNGQTSATSGGVSGQHLIINCDGVQYKIELRNP